MGNRIRAGTLAGYGTIELVVEATDMSVVEEKGEVLLADDR